MELGTQVTIKDGDLDKTFIIVKMRAIALDSFINLALKSLVKDNVKFPAELTGGDIRQTIFGLVQNGKTEDNAKSDAAGLMEHLLPILRSAYANLEESERISLLDKLLSTATYVNGAVRTQLNYYECDNCLDQVASIYKLAWEVIRVNFTLLSAGK